MEEERSGFQSYNLRQARNLIGALKSRVEANKQVFVLEQTL